MAGIDLAWTGDFLLGIVDHFLPLRQPSGGAGDGEQHGEHLRPEAHGLVDDAGVEIDVGIELAFDEVLVFQRDALELQGDFELGVVAGDFKDLVGGLLDDAGARDRSSCRRGGRSPSACPCPP